MFKCLNCGEYFKSNLSDCGRGQFSKQDNSMHYGISCPHCLHYCFTTESTSIANSKVANFKEAMDYLECEIAKVSTDLETLPWKDKNAEIWLQFAEIWLDAMREKEERMNISNVVCPINDHTTINTHFKTVKVVFENNTKG